MFQLKENFSGCGSMDPRSYKVSGSITGKVDPDHSP